MPDPRLPWQDLQFFLATAQHGTLAAAAEQLDVSSATVHRRLATLEKRLGTRLFVRSPRGYNLTEAGNDLLVHVESIDAEALSAERLIGGRDDTLRGEVRVTTVDDLYLTVLSPIFRDFSRKHDEVCIDVSLGAGHLNLARRQADVAIRPGAQPDHGDVVAKRICRIGVTLYASDQYLQQNGSVELDALHGHHLVRGSPVMANLPMERFIDRYADRGKVTLRSDSMLTRYAAVRDGHGLGMPPCFMGDRDDKLVRICPPPSGAESSLWIIVHADLRRNARVRAFVEYCQQRLVQQREVFEGTGSD